MHTLIAGLLGRFAEYALPLAAESGAWGWKGWPFSATGYGGGWLAVAAKFLFVALIVGLLVLVLRLLFGPKGPLREKGFTTIQEAKQREEEQQRGEQDRNGREPRDR
jgi:uncharacterized membrane protein